MADCAICGKPTKNAYGVCATRPECKREYGRLRRTADPAYYREKGREAYEKHAERVIWYEAKRRAKKIGIPFTITKEDIVIPAYCPVLGIKLERNAKSARFNSPSLDRIIPDNGYVPGNVEIISHRANSMKNDASPEEIKLFSAYYAQKFGL